MSYLFFRANVCVSITPSPVHFCSLFSKSLAPSEQTYFFDGHFMFIIFYLLFLYFLKFLFFPCTANTS